ncbi:MAG: hypothetical protein WC539_05815 [Nitrospirota bacterium]
MAEDGGARGKSMKAVASDVAEGYVIINPLFIKKFNKEMVKSLYEHINKAMNVIRIEKVSYSDVAALRTRNMKLQRLHNTLIVLRNFAREKRIPL